MSIKVKDTVIFQEEDNLEDDILYFLQKVKNTEKKYRELKVKYASRKNSKLLSTNWDEINKKRVEKDLPKLSNQSMKDAYISSLFEDLELEVESARVQYHYFSNVLKAKMEKLV